MARITSRIKKENYRIEISSPSGNSILADEPVDLGGKDAGFSPKELLAAALAACSSATVKMYADRKGWELEEVKIDTELAYLPRENKTIISRKLTFTGNLDAAQKLRLLAIADACPVHKILSNPVEISSQTAE